MRILNNLEHTSFFSIRIVSNNRRNNSDMRYYVLTFDELFSNKAKDNPTVLSAIVSNPTFSLALQSDLRLRSQPTAARPIPPKTIEPGAGITVLPLFTKASLSSSLGGRLPT